MLYSIYVLVLLLISNIDKGYCLLRCYSCSSKSDEGCINPVKNNLPMTNCTKNGLNETKYYGERIDDDFKKLFEVDINAYEPHGMVNCLKQVTKVGNKQYVLRGCQLAATEKLDVCVKVMQMEKENLRTTHCSLCNSNGCNSAPNSLIPPTKIIFIVAFLWSAYFCRN